jgi:hypothetical protein
MDPAPLPSDDDDLLALAGFRDPPAPDEGLFREGCWLRRISAESVLLFGGGRALLLEVAHWWRPVSRSTRTSEWSRSDDCSARSKP